MADLKAMKKATDKLNDPTFLSELIRFRSAMMLSGPSTIEAAALSNMSKLWTEPFVEWWGHLGRGAESEFQLHAKDLQDYELSIVLRNGCYAIYAARENAISVEGNLLPPEKWVWLPEEAVVKVGDGFGEAY